MTYETRMLQPLLRELSQKRAAREAEAVARRIEIYKKVPRVAEIDAELRQTMLDVVKTAFLKRSDVDEMLASVRDHNLALQAERAECLVAAGYPYDVMEAYVDCEACHDTGYVGQTVCTCLDAMYRKAQTEELDRNLTLGKEGFGGFCLTLYPETKRGTPVSPRAQMKEVYEYCVSYAKRFRVGADNVFMTGASGLGKSLLSACIAREVAMSGASVVYDTAFNLFSRFEEERFGRLNDETSYTPRRYLSCDLLVVDDLGAEASSSYAVAVLANLLSTRELRGKSTIINSTLGIDGIKKRYGSQTASRIQGDFITLQFYGDDNRGK